MATVIGPKAATGWNATADKWEYVRNNPVRHGFVSDRGSWPYQGQLHDLKG